MWKIIPAQSRPRPAARWRYFEELAVARIRRAATLAVRWRDPLFIPPMSGTMLLARRNVIRKQNKALAHLQECNALGRVPSLFGGIRASVCLIQILASCAHFSGPAMLVEA
jgi:hypothetical protein